MTCRKGRRRGRRGVDGDLDGEYEEGLKKK